MYFFWQDHTFSQWEYSEFTGRVPEFLRTEYPRKDQEFKFVNCEQWMMFNKAVLFNDETVANKILRTNNPAQIKKLGREVRGFDGRTWDAFKVKIVERGNLLKFLQNPNMLKELIETTGILVEASPYDKIWGIGLRATDPGANDTSKWKGQNLLGYSLTKLRDHLKAKGTTEAEIIAACVDDQFP